MVVQKIRPGSVGSVGETNLQVRLKKSANFLPERYYSISKGSKAKYFGSNVQDGTKPSFTTGGGPARVIQRKLNYRQGFKYKLGWIHEDLVPPDRKVDVKLGSTGKYGWKSKIAKVIRAKSSGDLFLPLPGGYNVTQADGITRGSQIPRIVAMSYGEKPQGPQPPQTTLPKEQYDINIDDSIYFAPKTDDPLRKLPIRGNGSIAIWNSLKQIYDWPNDDPENQQFLYQVTTTGAVEIGNAIAASNGGKGRPVSRPRTSKPIEGGGWDIPPVVPETSGEIDDEAYWVPPANDPRRDSPPPDWVRYKKWDVRGSKDWLNDDPNNVQIISEGDGSGRLYGVAHKNGGIGRPADEPIYKSQNVEMVPAYTPDPNILWTPEEDSILRQSNAFYQDWVDMYRHGIWWYRYRYYDWPLDTDQEQTIYIKEGDNWRAVQGYASSKGGYMRPDFVPVPMVPRST